jgi:S-disulfanyl-L-cysteine oxidoreductase SoxD
MRKSKILKLDDSCTSNPKSEILNWTVRWSPATSNLKCRISDLRCRTRPISKFLLFGVLLLLGLAILAHGQDATRTVWDGVYNEEQAQRGRAVFLDQCSNCHGRDLEGADMTPPLTGGVFLSNWDGLTLGDLADRIRVSMPLNSPGTLSRQQTVDVVAYILRFDQFPAGKEELPRESPALKQILFKARP